MVVSSSSEGSEERIDVLRRKIAALESLASNPGTTVAESESAQSAANKMRLELAKLVREAASHGAASPHDTWSGARHDEAAEPDVPEAEQTPREPASRTREPRPTSPPRRPLSIRSAPAWTWQVPGLGILVVVGIALWLQRSEQPSTSNPDGSPVAAMNSPAALNTSPAQQGQRSAILARIAERGGNAAVAEALRACHIRDLLKEFQGTSGAALRAGETPVDVRRRCGAYLTVRGVDDAICFPSTDANPHPVCPIPE